MPSVHLQTIVRVPELSVSTCGDSAAAMAAYEQKL